MPDARPSEAVHDGRWFLFSMVVGLCVHKSPRGFSRAGELLRRPFAHPFGIAVTPNVRRPDGPVSLVDEIAYCLADEMTGNRAARQTVRPQQLPFALKVFFRRNRLIDIEVVAPAGEFDAVVAHLFCERRQFFEGKVGPLASKEGDGACHGATGFILRATTTEAGRGPACADPRRHTSNCLKNFRLRSASSILPHSTLRKISRSSGSRIFNTRSQSTMPSPQAQPTGVPVTLPFSRLLCSKLMSLA